MLSYVLLLHACMIWDPFQLVLQGLAVPGKSGRKPLLHSQSVSGATTVKTQYKGV